MRIYSWNVNGVRAVQKKGAIQELYKTHQPDLLFLQETKATPAQASSAVPEGYHAYWSTAEKPGYAGTAIWSVHEPVQIHREFPADILEKYNLVDEYGDTSAEGRVTILEFSTYYAVSVYTPNAKDDLTRLPVRTVWDRAFLEYMTRLDKRKPMVVGGDFNVAHTEIDLARPKANRGKKGFTNEERGGFDALLNAGFVDTFRLFTTEGGHYTWWSHFARARERNVGWRIDYLLVSARLAEVVTTAEIHPHMLGSDHCPVSITLQDQALRAS